MRTKFQSITIAVSIAACAASVRASGVGTTGAEFLKVGVGARPLAMGSAFSAMVDDANSLMWNPGGLGAVSKSNVTASYNSLFVDENQGFLGYVMPMQDKMGTLGVGLDYLTVGKIEKRAADTESPDSTFSNQNFALMGSYGRMLGDSWSVGGSLKFIRETLDAFSANAVAIDVGGLYKTRIENLTAGVSMQNLGTKLGPDQLPLIFKGGVAYKMFNQKLALASDVDWLASLNQSDRAYWDLGTEYWVNKALALRAGYQLGHGQDRLSSSWVGVSAGMGLRVDRFALDYAFLPYGNLGNTHRITLGFYF